MEPNLGWTLLSREALRRAEKQLHNNVQGVRDEIGFLALHQAYANRFFPGTSVLHTRLRYALFVPWLYMRLMQQGIRDRIPEALQGLERELTGRLKKAGESGIIGAVNYPKPTTQPPCLVYWSALGAWRVLRPLKDGSYPARSVIHRSLSRRSPAGRLQDDDKQMLREDDAVFAGLPAPPESWDKVSEPVDFRLLPKERSFLASTLLSISRPDSTESSLLSRLVEHQVKLTSNTQLWSPPVKQAADAADRAAIDRARQAAALSAIGRAVYAALVEDMRDKKDCVETDVVHRGLLDGVIEEYGGQALKLDVEKVREDATKIDGKILDVLQKTQAWVRKGAKDVNDLYTVYAEAEYKRKNKRARLSSTLLGREKRFEWLPEEHPEARPLHYRWGNVVRFMIDLGVDHD